MPDVMRWRYGDTNPVVVPVDGATVIEIGDLVLLDEGNARPASATPYVGRFAEEQENFHDLFLGVAMQRSRSGETEPIRVATSGVFEFDCEPATFERGTRIGVSDDAKRTKLLSQQVIRVPGNRPQESIGVCAKQVYPANRRVLVDIASTVMRGGRQAPA